MPTTLTLRAGVVFSAVMALFFFIGCQPSSDVVNVRATEAQLSGKWFLKNSPGGAPGRQKLPDTKNGFILLNSNGVAALNGILVEELYGEGGPNRSTWRVRTSDGSWNVEQHAAMWEVRITLKDGQRIPLEINERRDGVIELHYLPDPEMAEPFIFVQADKAKSK